MRLWRRWTKRTRRRGGDRASGTVIESTPGGSEVIQYDMDEFRDVIELDQRSELLMEQRERIYREVFGECDTVNHEIIPRDPHIDVYHFPPVGDRNYHTLVTGGMSNRPMTLPRGVGRECARAEMAAYVPDLCPHAVEALRLFARFAHDFRTWLWFYHTVPNGNPPQPFVDGSDLNTALFVQSFYKPDAELAQRYQIDGDPVNLLCLLPITQDECEHKLQLGAESLLERFDAAKLPIVIDWKRASVL